MADVTVGHTAIASVDEQNSQPALCGPSSDAERPALT
jgi:hypothetical protein